MAQMNILYPSMSSSRISLHSTPIPLPIKTRISFYSSSSSFSFGTTQHPNSQSTLTQATPLPLPLPTMSDIIAASKSQKVNIELKTLGPFFRITATSLANENVELGRAEGVIRPWWGARILHLDSMKLQKETVSMEKSIFGIGLFVGAIAIRHGYDSGCTVAQLLAINDSDLYHSKLVRFYTRIGFQAVHEVTGSSIGDMINMLVWGGYGTRMDADVKQLLIKWRRRLKA